MKGYAAYLEMTRTVDSRRERIQYVIIQPFKAETLTRLWPTAPEMLSPADVVGLWSSQFTVWERRQDHADHRSRWSVQRVATKERVIGTYIEPYSYTPSVARRLTHPWMASPVIFTGMPESLVVGEIAKGTTPYRVINKLKAKALKVHGLDIS